MMIKIVLFPLRAAVSLIGYFSYIMESSSDYIIGAHRKSEYVRTGRCKKCGTCCHLIGLVVPKNISKRSWLVRLVRSWHSIGLNFSYAGECENALVYTCGYFKHSTDGSPGRCTIYPFRHRLCRFYPRQSLYGFPDVHPDCGFKFVRRDVLKKERETKRNGRATFSDVINKIK